MGENGESGFDRDKTLIMRRGPDGKIIIDNQPWLDEQSRREEPPIQSPVPRNLEKTVISQPTRIMDAPPTPSKKE